MRNLRLLGIVGLMVYFLCLHALSTIPAEATQLEKAKIALPPPPKDAPITKAEDEGDFTDRVILPRERAAERMVETARQYVLEEDWSNAIKVLQYLLNSKEDNFLKDEKGRWVSVRNEANRILGSMPRDGQQFYEQKYGSEARQILKRGLAAGDPQVYADVALRYMHTEAGSEAGSHLGTYHLDHGRYIVAALCYERLLSREGMLERLPAVTLYKAAISFERAGDLKNRDRVWTQFQNRVENGGERLPAGLRRMDVGQLRNALAVRQAARGAGERADWPLFLGSPDRAALADGGAPFLAPRLKLEMIPAGSQVKDWLDKALMRHSSKAQAQLCGFHPIAVGGKLVYRSYWGVHVHDLRTGELEWKAPAGMSLDYMARERAIIDPTGQMQQWLNAYQGSVPTMFYDNSTLGTLSSDGQRVYLVEDLAIPPHPNYLLQNRWGGMPPLSPQLQKWMEHNKLSAYDLSTGKLVWDLGTEDPDKPFAGAFFLGPPLPLGEKLYVLAEMGSGEIRLLCIDPIGKASLVWSQTLCLVERRLGEDPARRTQAAHLAYGDGVLVCPTNAGVVLAVDLLTRSLVWAHSYQESGGEGSKAVKPQPGMGMPGYAAAISPASWASSAPMVRDGLVVFTAPDGQSVRCLNLRDGSLVWREVQQNDLYLAGVFGDKVLIVGKECCRALHLKDGKELWKVATTLPAGRGACNGKEYFLPLKSAEVWTIDIEKGVVLGKSRSGRVSEGNPPVVPGNLVFHDGEVVSQSATLVTVFPQLAAKESAITKLLQEKPSDPRGLTERGDMRLNRGDLVGAVADLRLALEQKEIPGEVQRHARDNLYEAFGDLLQRDFAANEKHLAEFEQLVNIRPQSGETPEQKTKREEDERDRKARFLRVVARGREEQGRLTEALEAYLDFRKLGRKELLAIPEEPATRALPEVWIQGRIGELIRRAKPEQRVALTRALEEKWNQAQKAGTLEALEEFAALFGPLCAQGQKAKLLLAERLLGEKQFEQAQIKLWALAKQAEPEIAALALDALARLNTKLGELENAAFFYRTLAQKYPKIIIRDGKTAEEVYLDLATDKRFLPYLDEPRRGWTTLGPGEKFQYERAHGTFQNAQQLFWLEPEGDVPPQLRRFRLGVDQSTYRFKIVDQSTQTEKGAFILPSGALRPQIYNHQYKYRPTYRFAGGMVVFSWAFRAYGFDPMKPNQVLWSYSLLGENEQLQGNMNMGFNLMPNVNGQLEILYGDNYRERVGSLGPVEASFVTMLVRDEGLVAFDPLQVIDKKPAKRWVRSDVPIGTEIFGDGEHLYLVLSGRGEAGAGKGLAVRAIDGAPIEVPEFAALYQRRHAVSGRHLLLRDTDAQGNATLRLYDVLTGQDAWKKPLDPQAVLLNSFEPELTGWIDTQGKLTVLRIDTGKEVLTGTVDAATIKNSPEVHLLGDSSSLYVAFNNPLDPNAPIAERREVLTQNAGLRTASVNGPFHAFDRAAGRERWKRNVPPQALIVEQFAEHPLVLFASIQRAWIQPAGAGAQVPFQRNVNAVLALDKRDGFDGLGGKGRGGKDEIYKEDDPNRSGGAFHTIRIDPRMGVVELFNYNYKIVFRVASETAKAEGDSKPEAAQAPAAPQGLPAIQLVPAPGQVRLRLQGQQLEEVRRALEQAENEARRAEAARRAAEQRQNEKKPPPPPDKR
jgi:outer membrane protein assembly factor BamB